MPGGSANAYDYANQDPLNQQDLDGRVPVDMADGDASMINIAGALALAAFLNSERQSIERAGARAGSAVYHRAMDTLRGLWHAVNGSHTIMYSKGNKHIRKVIAGLEKQAAEHDEKELQDQLLGDSDLAKHHAKEAADFRARAERLRKRLPNGR